MDCRLVGTKPFIEPVLEYFQLEPKEKRQINLKRNSQFHSYENTVCAIAAILSRSQLVN